MSITRDFLTSAWGNYTPTLWDWALFLGTMGFFTFLLFLFIKFLPMINIFEVRDLLHRIHHMDKGHGKDGSIEDHQQRTAEEHGASAITPDTSGGLTNA